MLIEKNEIITPEKIKSTPFVLVIKPKTKYRIFQFGKHELAGSALK
jgi:hypothetical protein